LLQFLRKRGFLRRGAQGSGPVLKALLAYLGASRAEWILLNLEDLWSERRPQNTPGTTTERINWRLKAQLGLEELRRHAEVLAGTEAVASRRPNERKR